MFQDIFGVGWNVNLIDNAEIRLRSSKSVLVYIGVLFINAWECKMSTFTLPPTLPTHLIRKLIQYPASCVDWGA